jgi:hypothetical protein
MDIYFCDECGARVTDLDLRAGKGMRRRHATICPGCVDQGLAQAWLSRVGAQGAVAAQAQGNGMPRPIAGGVAVAEAPDPISVARDRARTTPDDPFLVDEPAPLRPLERPPVQDTDRLPSAQAQAQAHAQPATEDQPPVDDLAMAGGGFGALMNAAVPPPPPGLVDDPDERVADASEALPIAQPDTPFDFVSPADAENPGKAETAEVVAIDKREDVKRSDAKPTKTPSGRQQTQGKRSSTTTSRRNQVKPASTRRASKAMGNKKVLLLTLVSCAVMAIVFFGFVMPNVGKSKAGPPQQITEEPYNRLKESIDAAKAACHKALNTDDVAVVRNADHALKSMMEALDVFQKAADKRGWQEENYEEALRLVGFYDVQSMRKGVKDRLFILEQRAQ